MRPVNQNSIHDEIKSRNAHYHSLQNLLSSSLLPKNIQIKLYRTIIQAVVLYGCETWCLTLREEHRPRVFENICA
jgi:flagellar biosynthesis component FlhA